MSSRSMIALCAVAALGIGCGKGSSGSKPAPERPYTGAPVAFQVTKVSPEALDVDAYNFSDKSVAQYSILMRYYDAAGKPIVVEPGGPFEKDFDFWSMSGRHYLVKPKSWASFQIDHLEVPEGAVKAEVLARSVTALKEDGMHFEEKPLFELEGGMMEWPAKPAAAPAAPKEPK